MLFQVQVLCHAAYWDNSTLHFSKSDSSPEYLALQNKYDAVCDAIASSGPGAITTVVNRLKENKLIGGNVAGAAISAVDAGWDLPVIVRQLLQPMSTKISFSTQSFYHLCDALDIPDILVPVSEILKKECGACTCVCVRVCMCVCVCVCVCKCVCLHKT